jgi:hypothetical protein
MVLEVEATIVQSKDAHTQYLVIPSVMVQDSQYPFKAGERVKIVIDTHQNVLMIKSAVETKVKVSPNGIHVRGKKITVEK